MNDDSRTAPLKEWNRLARENTENAIVSSMCEAAAGSSSTIEQFSTWLLVGTAAVASFYISNADKLIPFISNTGFTVCGAFICASCIAGLASKIYALRCKVGIEMNIATKQTFSEHLDKYKEEENKIKEGAEFWGISLDTGVRIERVLSEFYATQPKHIVWIAKRILKKYEGNPQIAYIPIMKALNKQGVFSFFQSLLFLGFLISGFIFASII